MKPNLAYLYLLSPLHTGGTSQEGNLVGIARETHTDLPYLPSSTLRGRLRAATPAQDQASLWGHTLEDVNSGQSENLTQGALWLGDAGLLFFPVPSLSHGLVWITCPLWLRRWLRLQDSPLSAAVAPGSFSGGRADRLYLKDAIFQAADLQTWTDWRQYRPQGHPDVETITSALVVSDADAKVLVNMSLWRQVRVNLGEDKTLAANAGFRYEEAIPPETLCYFPWDTTTSAQREPSGLVQQFCDLVQSRDSWQFGGQESLGRGFVSLWTTVKAA